MAQKKKIGGRSHRRNVACRWIYICNLVLMTLNIVVIIAGAHTWSNTFTEYLPIDRYDVGVLWMYIGPCVEIGLCLLGCVATTVVKRALLKAYFYLFLFTISTDVFIGVYWTFRLNLLHQHLADHLLAFYKTRPNTFCRQWLHVEAQLNCCGVAENSNDGATRSLCERDINWVTSTPHLKTCSELSLDECVQALLLHVHQGADFLFLVGYCVAFIFKLFYVAILQKEIKDLVENTYYMQHRQEDINWISENASEKLVSNRKSSGHSEIEYDNIQQLPQKKSIGRQFKQTLTSDDKKTSSFYYIN